MIKKTNNINVFNYYLQGIRNNFLYIDQKTFIYLFLLILFFFYHYFFSYAVIGINSDDLIIALDTKKIFDNDKSYLEIVSNTAMNMARFHFYISSFFSYIYHYFPYGLSSFFSSILTIINYLLLSAFIANLFNLSKDYRNILFFFLCLGIPIYAHGWHAYFANPLLSKFGLFFFLIYINFLLKLSNQITYHIFDYSKLFLITTFSILLSEMFFFVSGISLAIFLFFKFLVSRFSNCKLLILYSSLPFLVYLILHYFFSRYYGGHRLGMNFDIIQIIQTLYHMLLASLPLNEVHLKHSLKNLFLINDFPIFLFLLILLSFLLCLKFILLKNIRLTSLAVSKINITKTSLLIILTLSFGLIYALTGRYQNWTLNISPWYIQTFFISIFSLSIIFILPLFFKKYKKVTIIIFLSICTVISILNLSNSVKAKYTSNILKGLLYSSSEIKNHLLKNLNYDQEILLISYDAIPHHFLRTYLVSYFNHFYNFRDKKLLTENYCTKFDCLDNHNVIMVSSLNNYFGENIIFISSDFEKHNNSIFSNNVYALNYNFKNFYRYLKARNNNGNFVSPKKITFEKDYGYKIIFNEVVDPQTFSMFTGPFGKESSFLIK